MMSGVVVRSLLLQTDYLSTLSVMSLRVYRTIPYHTFDHLQGHGRSAHQSMSLHIVMHRLHLDGLSIGMIFGIAFFSSSLSFSVGTSPNFSSALSDRKSPRLA